MIVNMSHFYIFKFFIFVTNYFSVRFKYNIIKLHVYFL